MQNKVFKFVEKFKFFICISLAIIIAGICVNVFVGTKLDINFKGGSMATYSFSGTIDHAKAEDEIFKAIGTKVSVSESQGYASESKSLVVTIAESKTTASDTTTKIETALTKAFPSNSVKFLESKSVNPTIGMSFFQKSLYAMIIAAALVVIYVGFRFRKIGGVSAAITSLLALTQDIIIVYFVYVLLRIPLDTNFIAVILTILGYGLNDTIVVYDRVRENKRIYGSKFSARELMNLSITQSFRRSMVTSLATFIAIATVAVVAGVFGLTSIMSFAIPMSIGVVWSAFSSICIAGPLWVYWLEFKEKRQSKKAKK